MLKIIKRLATIEIGSRAIRLLISELDESRKVVTIKTESKQIHLQSVLYQANDYIVNNIDKLINDVNEIRSLAVKYGVDKIIIFGTAAIRSLPNQIQKYLIKNIHELIIFSKKEEAVCSFISSAMSFLNDDNKDYKISVIDLGAGSIELSFGMINNSVISLNNYKSYKLGTQLLIEYLQANSKNYKKLDSYLTKRIEGYSIPHDFKNVLTIIAGSSITKYAWLDLRTNVHDSYNPRLVHGYYSEKSKMDLFINSALKDSNSFHKLIDPKNPSSNEYDTVVSGLMLISILLKRINVQQFFVSAWGVRHGLSWLVLNGKDMSEFI